MVDSADEPPLSRLHSWAKSKALPLQNPLRSSDQTPSDISNVLPQYVGNNRTVSTDAINTDNAIPDQIKNQQNASVVVKKGDGKASTTIDQKTQKPPIFQRFVRDVKRIILASWVNWLLVFAPVGIILGAIADWGGIHVVSPSVIFALNAVAIIPLASLLAFATESVAIRLGDTVGALLNVTFGNAVEIIIFVISLTANQVRIVQAAALGSILSNLLLILGMAFVFGGMRYREQVYNPRISQMSACLLSLSVISLLLPTAFHAAFSNDDVADQVVLKVSRGTSVVLLLVYVIYLLFQLKSHAFMYESTPQNIIDEESHPGILAEMLNSSGSSSDSSSSSSSDSDSTSGSHKTAKRFRRALRRKRRKSTSSTKETDQVPAISRSTTTASTLVSPIQITSDGVFSGDEADAEDRKQSRRESQSNVQSRDFEIESSIIREKRKKKKKTKQSGTLTSVDNETFNEKTSDITAEQSSHSPAIKVVVAADTADALDESSQRRPFHIRNLSNAVKPAFNSTVFPHHEAVGRSLAVPALRPYERTYANNPRRASSMPDINRHQSPNPRSASPRPHLVTHDVPTEVQVQDAFDPKKHLSKTSSVVLLICTTALVALCAEFLVGSIDFLVSNSGVSPAFIGLIILPIVGNAAEHVTAVTVAYKNKMDLAINIALGSSIQIALFVTPLMVMLGWAIGSDMSLYFTLFETMSLFASAFIVNYLMIDGRSNYLEGTLLIAAYVIIAIAAFFYPSCGLSAEGGSRLSDQAC